MRPRRPCPKCAQPATFRRKRSGTETGRRAREAAAPRVPGATDGDAASQPEPQGPQDGIIVVGEPTAARDGIPDMDRDPRLPEDVAAFTSPPAGYNPYLY